MLKRNSPSQFEALTSWPTQRRMLKDLKAADVMKGNRLYCDKPRAHRDA
jgi:hypothetical protein